MHQQEERLAVSTTGASSGLFRPCGLWFVGGGGPLALLVSTIHHYRHPVFDPLDQGLGRGCSTESMGLRCAVAFSASFEFADRCLGRGAERLGLFLACFYFCGQWRRWLF